MMEFVTSETFRIDPEFANEIPPIGADEFKQLRENILAAGEVYESLVVWNGVLIDGHNRWKVIQEKPDIKYKVREMDFPDKWAAFEWMYKNHLGRRNLADEQQTYMIGKMYEARKRSNGGTGANQYTSAKEQLTQNGKAANPKQGTAGEIAREMGMGNNTVIRAEKFANGVDALREVSPEAAAKVISGAADICKKDVAHIAKQTPEQIKEVAESILGNKPMPKVSKPKKNNGYSSEMRDVRKMIDEAYKPMLDETAQSKYTVEDFADEIITNGTDYTNYLSRIVAQRKELLDNDTARNIAITAINNVIEMIVKVRESL